MAHLPALSVTRVLTACSTALALLSGCASDPAYIAPSAIRSHAEHSDLERAATALRAGKGPEARALLARELRVRPDDGYLHLLNGLTYQVESSSPQALELAQVGYDAAARFADGYYWSEYCEGDLELAHRRYPAAAERFARAIREDPTRPEAFDGLATAAYLAGDLEVAWLASRHALAVAPDDPAALRIAVFVAAASGDATLYSEAFDRARAVAATRTRIEQQRPRLEGMRRTAAFAAANAIPGNIGVAQAGNGPAPASSAQGSTAAAAEGAAAPSVDRTQLMIEVTLLLSQGSQTRNIGINLLDGLSVQFSGQKTTHRDNSVIPVTTQQTVTSALNLPQITYSLNLFNTRQDYYEVIARPSLVASLGQESQFFIGRTVSVGVSGVNLGTVQPIDVGTSVKVNPIEITDKGAKFRIDVARSFFTNDIGGNFQQQLTTFKQTVGATVEVDFGRTLILSGLYEGVNVGSSSKVPLLGDVPILDSLTNSRIHTVNQDAALVLVTPKATGTIAAAPAEFRGEQLRQLMELWDRMIEPRAGLEAIIGTLQHRMQHFRPLAGDVPLPSPTQQPVMAALLDDTLRRVE
jgi:tetratricopeptide (TPR) repeat protein